MMEDTRLELYAVHEEKSKVVTPPPASQMVDPKIVRVQRVDGTKSFRVMYSCKRTSNPTINIINKSMSVMLYVVAHVRANQLDKETKQTRAAGAQSRGVCKARQHTNCGAIRRCIKKAKQPQSTTQKDCASPPLTTDYWMNRRLSTPVLFLRPTNYKTKIQHNNPLGISYHEVGVGARRVHFGIPGQHFLETLWYSYCESSAIPWLSWGITPIGNQSVRIQPKTHRTARYTVRYITDCGLCPRGTE